MTDVGLGDSNATLPAFVQAAEVALRELPPGAPLRALIFEQFLDSVSRSMPREGRLIALALLGCADEDANAMGQFLSTRPAPEPSIERDRPNDQGGHEHASEMTLDLLVLTPKGPELSAAMAAFGLSGPPSQRVGEDSDLWLWTDNELKLGLAVIGTDGNVEAALELHRIASSIEVGAAVLVGMAAGLKGAVEKGDIVIASWVAAYEFARLTKQRYIPRSKLYQADMRSVQKVSQTVASYPDWGASLWNELRKVTQFKGIDSNEPEKLTKAWRPAIKTGVVFAGSRLIEDGSLKKMRDDINDRGLAAEMEGAGFAAACSALRIPWLVVRGIADYGEQDNAAGAEGKDVSRGKSWQFPSTYAAAAYVREMVITGRIPLIENARSRPR